MGMTANVKYKSINLVTMATKIPFLRIIYWTANLGKVVIKCNLIEITGNNVTVFIVKIKKDQVLVPDPTSTYEKQPSLGGRQYKNNALYLHPKQKLTLKRK
ncbi:hypothetical protein GCM10023231_42020 [Olivibacter ginsenosidimutans]|uniref:Uncharacterized protein n=1 Tax=Olivibacter ginsenosidimutans TaxID=1176537 RepID=A0ABP9CHG9_9SPHI